MYARIVLLALFIGAVSVAYTAPLASEARGGAWRAHASTIETQVREHVSVFKERVEAVRGDMEHVVKETRERAKTIRHRFGGVEDEKDTDEDKEDNDDTDQEPNGDSDDDTDTGDEGQDENGTDDDEGGNEDDDGNNDDADNGIDDDDATDDGTDGDGVNDGDEGDEDSDEGGSEDSDDGSDNGDEGGAGDGDTSDDEGSEDDGTGNEGDESTDDGSDDPGSGEEGDEGTGNDGSSDGGTDGDDGTGDGGAGDTPPAVAMLRITEVLYDPDPNGNQGTDNDNEWIEIHNAGDTVVDLAGWSIGDGTATDVLTDAPLVLPADAYLIVTRYASTSKYWAFPPETLFLPINNTLGDRGLTNSGESVILYDATGAIVDAVSWGVKSASAPELIMLPAVDITTLAEGESIYRLDPTTDTDTAADWGIHEPDPGV